MQRNRLAAGAVAAFLIAVSPHLADAQRRAEARTGDPRERATHPPEEDRTPRTRESTMWYGLAVGAASTRLACDICDRSRDTGASISLAFGAHASPNLRVGIEGSRWTHLEGDTREDVHALGVVAHVARASWRGLYVLGGAGWSGYRAGTYRSDAPRISLGLGYDVPLAAGWVVGNVVALDASWRAPIRSDARTVVTDVGLSTFRVAAQLHRR